MNELFVNKLKDITIDRIALKKYLILETKTNGLMF